MTKLTQFTTKRTPINYNLLRFPLSLFRANSNYKALLGSRFCAEFCHQSADVATAELVRETLTAKVKDGKPAFIQRRPCRQITRSTQAPISTIRPMGID